MFQSSTSNQNSYVAVLPNGTASKSGWYAYSSNDPANSAYLGLFSDVVQSVSGITSNAAGSGTSLPLAIFTSGLERMRIDNSGNVGIGTTAPGGLLDVYGTGVNSAIIVPRDVTANRPTGVNGMIRYNTNLNIFEGFENNSWKQLISTGGGGTFGDGTVSAPSITFTSDTDTGLYRPSANNLGLVTGGTARMTIDQYGRIGVGTTLPGASMHVDGLGLRVTGTVTESLQNFDRVDAGVAAGTPRLLLEESSSASTWEMINDVGDLRFLGLGTGSGDVTFLPSGNERMRITKAGYVGIGTNNPTTDLHISKSGFVGTIIESTAATGGQVEVDINSYGTSGQSMLFLTASRGSKASPSYNQANDTIGYLAWGPSNNSRQSARITSIATNNWTTSSTPGDLEFATTGSGSTSPTVRMKIDQSGNVGIGTTSPAGPLHVARSSSTYPAVVIDTVGSAQNGTSDIQLFTKSSTTGGLNATTNQGWQISARGDSFSTASQQDRLIFGYWNGSAWNNAGGLVLDPSGNVGVGTTSPSERLHVVGNLRVQGSTDCTLGNGAGGTNCSSDIRLKDNVTEIEDSLKKVLSLRGVEFTWNEKSQSPGRHDIGVIAQDVEKAFPTAVMEDAHTGYKKVDYAVLVAPVIQALKELNQRIQSLFSASQGHSDDIAQLKAENSRLKASDEAKGREIASVKAKADKAEADAANANAKADKSEKENAELKARMDRLERMLKAK